MSLGDGLTRRGREGAGGRGEEKGSGGDCRQQAAELLLGPEHLVHGPQAEACTH